MTTYVNGSRADLLAGLNHMIGLVEDLKDVYEFDMNMYSWCVIGQTVMRGNYWEGYENKILEDIFGITVFPVKYKEPMFADFLFIKGRERPRSCSEFTVAYNEDQLKVLSLFTAAICRGLDDTISRKSWLELAKKTYKEMMGI
ncbi:hypothetical protein Ac42p189 [Acinetobacter phage Ac42]|uniref:hypothetical protein n=1 Tax=Acinetobacter phage Ac42 TaxID=762660 RepID=UPI0001EBCDB7|nr:hypothetical protein Ac42p189 [Acinetobacter phage Ac42]ADI96427.1 hypothetical protein Ac42p189 [Acinetobacter phage Ac42]